MTNSNLETNLKIIEELTKIIENNPEWRFQQILWNCGIICRNYNDQDELEIEDKFYENSEITLNTLQKYSSEIKKINSSIKT